MGDVGLLHVVGHLEVEGILGVLVKHLSVGPCSDFCDFFRCSIAKPFYLLRQGGAERERGGTAAENNQLKISRWRCVTLMLDG